MYFITSICGKSNIIPKGTNGHYTYRYPIPDCRTVGYFSEYKDAENVVTTNQDDIYESGCYPWVCIENVPEGLYQWDSAPVLFAWNKDKKNYERCSKPVWLKDIIAFCIG